MKIVIVVQARMASTRLPGKVLKKVLDKPLLEYQIERLQRITSADAIVVATTKNEVDQPIIDLCNRLKVSYFRGSEADVLARYYGAAVQQHADVVVRVTADCPVIDPEICDTAIRTYLKNRERYDYLRLERYPRGLDVEVFAFTVLEECFKEAAELPDREHVTPFIYRHPDRYRIYYMNCPEDYSHYRWTVDTEEDFELVRKILEELYPVKARFDFDDIVKVMVKYPEWYCINHAVHQKGYGE
jgi:spore coat polysaccharide biosynthesis protein SpsF